MISEKAIGDLLSSMLPSGRLNPHFESDAELIRLGDCRYLFTTDEFSAEDQFREDDPYSLGWNIAVGGISDIFACGGVPLYYAHALTVGPRWDAEYLAQFGGGVREVLDATGARFIGGDCGRSPLWRCTVSVIGSCAGAAVGRRGAAPGHRLYLSGPVGAGNFEAALTLGAAAAIPGAAATKNRFALRGPVSALMKPFASACLDTSDGVCAALNTLADINQCGYAVADLPYLETGLRFCEKAGWPRTLLFLGECGEYELLFTVPPDQEPAFLAEARKTGCHCCRLGQMTPAGRTLMEDGRELDLASLHLQARDYATPQRYLADLVQWLERQKPQAEKP